MGSQFIIIFLEKNAHFGETWTPKKIVIFWHKLPLRLASDSKKKNCAHAQSSFEFPFPFPFPQSSQKREWVIPRFPFLRDLRERPSLEIKDRLTCTQCSRAFSGWVVTYDCGLLEKSLDLSRNSGAAERKRPCRGGLLWKRLEKIGPKPYSLGQFYLLQHNALRFMIAYFRAGKLHSCLYYSSDRPCSLGGVFWILEITSLLEKLTFNRQNRQDRACRIELADSGLNLISKHRSCYRRYHSSTHCTQPQLPGLTIGSALQSWNQIWTMLDSLIRWWLPPRIKTARSTIFSVP